MRRVFCIAALIGLLGAVASADPRSEMIEALIAQAELHPGPALLPVATAASHVAQTPAARAVPPRAAVIGGRAAAEQAQQAQGASAALAHQAQAAAMSAAGQAQAQAARQRAVTHPHPGR